jgi:aminoglycoside 6'-N-acetyltransferase
MSPYHFRPFAELDIPLAKRWLKQPELLRWWGDPQRELALLREDLCEPRMRQWIVEHNARPFAYAQAYEAHAWPQAHLAQLPYGTQVIDTFIGEPDMLGCGHGPAFLKLLAGYLIDGGAPVVAIDPDAENHRARRAYARAGFEEAGGVAAEQGPVVLMLFRGRASSVDDPERSAPGKLAKNRR